MWGGGATPASPVATGEIPLSALLFCKLFSCTHIVKRKAANNFLLFNERLLGIKQLFVSGLGGGTKPLAGAILLATCEG